MRRTETEVTAHGRTGHRTSSTEGSDVVATRASIAGPTTVPSPSGVPGISRRTLAMIAGVGLPIMAVLAPLAHFGVLENLRTGSAMSYGLSRDALPKKNEKGTQRCNQ